MNSRKTQKLSIVKSNYSFPYQLIKTQQITSLLILLSVIYNCASR